MGRVIRKKTMVMVLLLIFFSFLLFLQPLDAGKCEDALFRCTVTALIIGVGDWVGGLTWEAFCLIGYNWCLEFMG